MANAERPTATRLPAGRRTQAERSATTRARIIDAAVQCLFKDGYGATTTVSVAATAAVSRGAMLHHFPSKADLMLATLSHVLEANAEQFRAAAARIADPAARELAFPDLRLEIALLPAGVAFTEIIVGARSDETVRARFGEFQEQLRARASQRSGDRPGGSQPDDRGDAISRTIALAVFGLAIQRMVLPGIDSDDVMSVLRTLKRDGGAAD